MPDRSQITTVDAPNAGAAGARRETKMTVEKLMAARSGGLASSVLQLDLALQVILPADLPARVAEPQRIAGFLQAGEVPEGIWGGLPRCRLLRARAKAVPARAVITSATTSRLHKTAKEP